MVAIDHFYVFCREAAPEQQLLRDRGLKIGATRDHAGQGTANVCFGFADCYLELIWLHDEEAALQQSQQALGLDRRMRWRDHGASPFGICLQSDEQHSTAPFAHWQYRPGYLPEGMHIDVGTNSRNTVEPMLFHLARPITPMQERHKLSEHRLHKLIVDVPDLTPTSPWRTLDVDGLQVRDGREHYMEVHLRKPGEAPAGHDLDLAPALPVRLRW